MSHSFVLNHLTIADLSMFQKWPSPSEVLSSVDKCWNAELQLVWSFIVNCEHQCRLTNNNIYILYYIYIILYIIYILYILYIYIIYIIIYIYYIYIVLHPNIVGFKGCTSRCISTSREDSWGSHNVVWVAHRTNNGAGDYSWKDSM